MAFGRVEVECSGGMVTLLSGYVAEGIGGRVDR